ncbi:MAG: GNAT family N-acetyltransferase [Chloroflexota bacterium]
MLREALDLRYAAVALDGDELVGLAGFHTDEGSLTGGLDVTGLIQQLGWLGATRAALVLSFYERKPATGELLMDGISVRADQRGQGVGTRLLHALKQYANERGYNQIRLDVIDTNAGARRLYEREGFVPVADQTFEYLRSVLGFGGSTTMVWTGNKEPV